MCRRPTTIRRFSSRASQGIAAFFSIDKKNKDHVCSPSRNNSQKQTTSNNNQEKSQQTIYIKPVILFGAILSSAAIAYYVGVIISILTLSNSAAQFNGPSSPPPAANLSFAELMDGGNKQLPPPTVIPGKEVPPTTYTFQHFPTGGSRINYDLLLDRSDEEYEHDNVVNKSTEDSSDDSSDESSEDGSDDPLEGLHLPAGQHLLIDIKNVDPIFLNSEDRLAEAMIQLVDESKLTLLSYHCQ